MSETPAGIFMTQTQLTGLVFGVPTVFAIAMFALRELYKRVTGDRKKQESAQSTTLKSIQALGNEVRTGFQEMRDLIHRQGTEHQLLAQRVGFNEAASKRIEEHQDRLDQHFADLERRLMKVLEDTRHNLRSEFSSALLKNYNAIVRALNVAKAAGGPNVIAPAPPFNESDGEPSPG